MSIEELFPVLVSNSAMTICYCTLALFCIVFMFSILLTLLPPYHPQFWARVRGMTSSATPTAAYGHCSTPVVALSDSALHQMLQAPGGAQEDPAS